MIESFPLLFSRTKCSFFAYKSYLSEKGVIALIFKSTIDKFSLSLHRRNLSLGIPGIGYINTVLH